MLITITSKCNENCPHCMQDCHPDGEDMVLDIFEKSVLFSKFLGARTVILSGGELTLHPDWYEFCKLLQFKYKTAFGICTNGTWIEDSEVCAKISRVKKFSFCVAIQVYANPKYYKSYNFIKSNEAEFHKLGLSIDKNPIQSLKDLGRAHYNNLSELYNQPDKYYMSCLNAALCAKQIAHPSRFCSTLELSAAHFCTPCVSPTGTVHLSESFLCPYSGNINKDKFEDIWRNIIKFKPCGKCNDYKRFTSSLRPDIIAARQFLNL